MYNIIAWIVIIFFSYSLSKGIERFSKLSSLTSIFVGFSLGPVMIGQFLYLLYTFFPAREISFYLAVVVVVSLIISFLLHGHIKGINIQKNTLPRLDWTATFYLFINIIIVLMVCLRTVLWPINWHDNIVYMKVADSYFVTSSTINEVNGVRPGLPLIINYFALFDQNNILVERSLMLTIFYYYVLTIIGLFILAKQQGKSMQAGLFAVGLLTTCFYFTNFTIYGFKEVIIISLLLSILMLYKELHLQKVKRDFVISAILAGLLFGAMSFVHMTGAVTAILLFASLLVTIRLSKKRLLLLAVIVITVAALSSMNEILFFAQWVIGGLFPPPFTNSLTTETATAINSLSSGELNSFQVVSFLDQLIKGKLQAYTQLQWFGVVFIFTTVLIVTKIKKTVSDPFGRFLTLFLLAFLFLITNPFSIFNHYASYVFLVSPKYYLLLLPIYIILASLHYSVFSEYLKKIQLRLYVYMVTIIAVFALLLRYNASQFTSELSRFIPTHYQPGNYYISRIVEISTIYLVVSGIVLTLLLIKKFRRNYKSLVEMTFFLFVFIIPFFHLVNNNFGIKNILTQFALDRNQKVVSIDTRDTEVYELISQLTDKHKDGQKVYVSRSLRGVSSLTEYLIRTKHNSLFLKELKEYEYVDLSENLTEETSSGYGWVIIANKDEDEIEVLWLQNHSLEYSNGAGKLYYKL